MSYFALRNFISPSLRMIIPCVLGIFLLTGCGHDDNHMQLKKYVEEVKERPSYHVEPMPKLQEHPTFIYPTNKQRNPFSPIKEKRNAIGQGPDQKRSKEPLEAYALDSLRMVGTIKQGSIMWAVISAPDGAIYNVAVGKHLGQNYGRIEQITDNAVNLLETIHGHNGWEKRPAKLALIKRE